MNLPDNDQLATALLEYVRRRRWFRSKSRPARSARVYDLIPLRVGLVALLEIGYQEGDPELYVVPLVGGSSDPAARVTADLADGLATGDSAPALAELIRDGATARGAAGELRGNRSPLLAEILRPGALPARVAGAEQTNSTVFLGDSGLMKIYRQVAPGDNPEVEVGRFLARHADPSCTPRLLGDLAYHRDGASYSLGVLHELVPNDGDAWTAALADVRAFLGGAPARLATLATTLGRRTGELHLALASDASDPAFAPEPLTAADRGAMADRTAAMLEENLATLTRALPRLEPSARAIAERVLRDRRAVIARLDDFRACDLEVVKTRIHGDLHLGQVLVYGEDFAIIDFEGEPARPLAERRAKSSPLRDVMGMVRSFDYAPAAVLRAGGAGGEQARRWTDEVSAAYLRGYFATVEGAPFIPRDPAGRDALCTFHQLEKVIYEVGYEANNRPDWVEIPLRGLGALAGLVP
jgi:maltose alpha-D-glucosyltransferase/alpha-amylase